jgi:hypothetical protein
MNLNRRDAETQSFYPQITLITQIPKKIICENLRHLRTNKYFLCASAPLR